MEENTRTDNVEEIEKEPETKETEQKEVATEKKAAQKKPLSKKAIIGIIIGAVALLTIIAVALVFLIGGGNGGSANAENDFYTEGLEFTRDWKGDYTVSVGSCKNAVEIVIPENYNGGKVVVIGEDAFSDCTSLRSINIPNSVETISRGAFSGCTELRNVTIPDSVTYIGNQAFYGCTSLENVDFPDSVMLMANNAFSDYNFLPNIAFHENAKYRGNDENPYFALIEAEASDTDSVTIHPSTKVIAPYALSNLKFDTVYYGGTAYDWFYGLSGKDFTNKKFTLFTADFPGGIKYGDLFSAFVASAIQTYVGVINGDETSIFGVAITVAIVVLTFAIVIPIKKITNKKRYRR